MTKKPVDPWRCFHISLRYVLDLLCYGYYCKAESLVSDKTFDELEVLWRDVSKMPTAPMRACEIEDNYTEAVRVVFELLKLRKEGRL